MTCRSCSAGGEDGQVKAFLNACKHKGSKVWSARDAFKGGRVAVRYQRLDL
ncbi:hypothetical protein [Massilia cavernae]|uniref:hypothetical protein n=1 Tax=Massilia cavernae TaxID=2320864 RepID=UPI0015FF1E4A|nr:hypothetical protein [Massilia cavernae]